MDNEIIYNGNSFSHRKNKKFSVKKDRYGNYLLIEVMQTEKVKYSMFFDVSETWISI